MGGILRRATAHKNVGAQMQTSAVGGGADKAECPLCGTIAEAFEDGGNPEHPRPDCKCPTCGSLERHRAFWLYFRVRTSLFSGKVRMLHMAAEPCIAERFLDQPNVDYITADLDPTRGMVASDLTRMAFADQSFDLILCSHVLEHIPDDLSAMRELRRILRPGGQAVLAVPMWRKVTEEDLTITDPAERLRRFGQNDHVRSYGLDGVFGQRLNEAGFDVVDDPIIRELDPTLRRRYRVLVQEPIFRCTYGVPVPPSAPTMLHDAVAGDRQATMSWVPFDPQSEAIAGYVVTAYDGYFPELSVTFNSPATTQTIGGLTNGVTYRFKVAAFNEMGTGTASKVSNPVVPGG
jgi:SAM-dependent methyltransferase